MYQKEYYLGIPCIWLWVRVLFTFMKLCMKLAQIIDVGYNSNSLILDLSMNFVVLHLHNQISTANNHTNTNCYEKGEKINF